MIKTSNADIQKRRKREFGTAMVNPKSENIGRTFSNNTPVKAVLSL
jgi:hypothetical protein